MRGTVDGDTSDRNWTSEVEVGTRYTPLWATLFDRPENTFRIALLRRISEWARMDCMTFSSPHRWFALGAHTYCTWHVQVVDRHSYHHGSFTDMISWILKYMPSYLAGNEKDIHVSA